MGSFNRVILIGRLWRDAEVKTLSSGATVASMSVATSETWKDRAGAKQEKTTWTRVVLWGKSAEAIGQYLTKGREIAVEGKLDNREWEKDGVKHYATDVKADRVVLLGSKDGAGASRSAASDDDEFPSGGGDARDDDGIPF